MTLLRTSRAALAAAAAAGLLASGVAHADTTWTWRYAGDGIDASGTLTTSGTADSNGWFEILSISGTRNGVAIEGLQAAGSAIPGNDGYPVDNLIVLGTPGGAQITAEGFGYTLADGSAANPYYADWTSPGTYYEVLTGAGNGFSEVAVAFSATPLTSAVPEPASAALLLAGLGALGLRARRRVS